MGMVTITVSNKFINFTTQSHLPATVLSKLNKNQLHKLIIGPNLCPCNVFDMIVSLYHFNQYTVT